MSAVTHGANGIRRSQYEPRFLF